MQIGMQGCSATLICEFDYFSGPRVEIYSKSVEFEFSVVISDGI